jgi:hypothetical protein
MAHELWPPEGAPYLRVEEILARWQRAFRHVRADPDAGRASIEEQIAYVASMIGRNQYFTSEELERLRRSRDHAVEILCADSERPGRAYIETVLEPDAKIFIAYSDRRHESAAAPLVARAAAALGYEVELV